MYDDEYYAKINLEEEEQAKRLADVLIWIYSPKSVLDIGSATGLYIKPFLEKGIKVQGVDYSVAAVSKKALRVPRELIKVTDITKKSIELHADLSLCIEVLEHIPEKYALFAIHNIARTSKTIFFTAAQPGQGGVGHVNCQPKSYWEGMLKKEGFGRDYADEDYIRIIMGSGYHMGWLTNNLMVFKKRK